MTGCKAGVVSRLFAGCCGLVLVALFVGVSGCGKPDTSLKAEVTYKGTKISGGSVDVISEDGKSRAGGPVLDGVLTIKKVPEGKLKVMFVAPKGLEIEPKAAAEDKKIQDFKTSGVEITVEPNKVNDLKIDFK